MRKEEGRDSGTVIRFTVKELPMELGSCHRQKLSQYLVHRNLKRVG